MTQDWRDNEDRACRGVPVDVFFPVGRSDSAGYLAMESRAVSYCARCPVRADCLWWAVDHGIVDGVWGGLGETARRALISRARKDVRAEVDPAGTSR